MKANAGLNIALPAARARILKTFTAWCIPVLLASMPGPTSLSGAEAVPAQLPAAAAREVDFIKDIQPILAQNCYRCHGSNAPKRICAGI
jgi:mono/diheme cytochrome c family protein